MSKLLDAPLTEPVTIPDYPEAVKALARTVIIEATRDVKRGNFDAWMWLFSQDTGETWGTCAGLRWSAVREWLTTKGAQPFVKEVFR
jgi:hypothetical protein